MEYKPILVIYYPESVVTDYAKDFLRAQASELEKAWGYNVLLMATEEGPRAEILSVDKATVIEDIQKYIDLKLIKNDKSST